MKDHITGIAVLDQTNDRLYFVAQRADGRRFASEIPILPEGTEDPKVVWRYRMEGEKLHGTPSINDQFNGWHNSLNWEIPVVIENEKAYPVFIGHNALALGLDPDATFDKTGSVKHMVDRRLKMVGLDPEGKPLDPNAPKGEPLWLEGITPGETPFFPEGKKPPTSPEVGTTQVLETGLSSEENILLVVEQALKNKAASITIKPQYRNEKVCGGKVEIQS